MRHACLALVWMGCSYTPTTAPLVDTPVEPDPENDFDADGIADDDDHCPHVNNAADPDADSDGVGDACDPNINTPTESRIAFYAFADASELADWTQTAGTWEITRNRLVQTDPAGLAAIELPAITGGVHVETSYEVDELVSGIDAEIGTCSGVIGATQHYCCDVIRKSNGTTFNAELWAQYPGQPLSIAMDTWTGAFVTGSRVDIVADLVQGSRNCKLEQIVSGNTVTKNLFKTETGPIDGTVELYMKNATAKYRFIFVAATAN